MDASAAGHDDAFTYLEVAEGVVVALARTRQRADGNAVLIDLGGQTVVVDTHGRPSAAALVQAFARQRFGRPIGIVVDTHHHWDHWQGNVVHAGDPSVRLLAHPSAIDAIRIGAKASFARQLDEIGEELAVYRAAGATQAIAELASLVTELEGLADGAARSVDPPGIPTEPVATSVELSGDRRTIRLVHLGPAHTAGDLVVELPAERAVMTGDCVVGWTPFFADADPEGWLAAVDTLLASDVETLLMGHGAPAGRDWLVAFRAYLADLLGATRLAWAMGLRAAALASEVRERLRPTHEAAMDREAGSGREWDHRMLANVVRVEHLLASGRLAP